MDAVFQWIGVILAALIALTVAVRAIVSLTPSKRDDEIVERVLLILRRVESLTPKQRETPTEEPAKPAEPRNGGDKTPE